MIAFNRPPIIGTEIDFINRAILQNNKLAGDGPFTKLCHQWIEDNFKCKKALLAPSCTDALELSALLANIQAGDEVIMPSYTFVSTANAFVLRNAKIVFVDIRPDTMNIDEILIEAAITPRTKAIVPVHYAGVACEMDKINQIAVKHGLVVIEDAAQGVMATYKNRALGALGNLGCYSFHETKNYTSGGEGGALLINDNQFMERAEIIREKGTNRSQFLRGQIDKYTWRDVGSSFLPSELQAAFLYAQLQAAQMINDRRLEIWNWYHREFEVLESRGILERPFIPVECKHNAHMYYLKLKNLEQRQRFIEFLKTEGVQAVFHYVPLHSSEAGRRFGRFHGEDKFTTKESERLVRLPLWYGVENVDVEKIIASVKDFLN